MANPAQLSAGVIPVVLVSPARFLLLRAYRYWDFPKGLVEVAETPFDAAAREFLEETGLPSPSFPWGKVCYDTEPYGRGKVARYHLGQLDEAVLQRPIVLPVSAELGRPEHHEARWVEYSEASELLNARVRGALNWAMRIIDGSN